MSYFNAINWRFPFYDYGVFTCGNISHFKQLRFRCHVIVVFYAKSLISTILF